MNEFGGCAAATKSVRIGLFQLMKQMSESFVNWLFKHKKHIHIVECAFYKTFSKYQYL